MWSLLRIGVIAVLIYYIFSGFNLDIFTKCVESIAWQSTVILVFVGLLADAVIAARWRCLSRTKCSFKAAFEAFMVSQFFNNLLPAKIGELTRVVYLKTFYGIKITSGFSALFIERIFDVVLLGALSLAAAHFFVGIENLERIALAILIGLSGGLLFLRTRRRVLMRFVQLFPNRSLRTYMRKIVHDMHKLLNLKKVFQMTLYTLVLWLLYFTITAAFLSFAANIKLTLVEYFVVFVVSSIAMSLPLAPAGAGTYHAGLIFSLGLYDVPKEEALAAAIVLHLLQITPPMLAALFVFWSKDVNLRTLGRTFGLSQQIGNASHRP